MDRTIEEGLVFVSQEEESSCSAAGLRADKEGSITVDLENHVRGSVEDFSFRIACSIVEEVLNRGGAVFGVLGRGNVI